MVLMADPGDQVQVKTKDDVVEGILLPSPDTGVVVVKLKSGYNVGFPAPEVQVTILGKKKNSSPSLPSSPQDPSLPHIALLHTGGTIASRVDYQTGGVSAGFSAEEVLDMFPEMKSQAFVTSHQVCNLMSEDMRFSHYQRIARSIQQQVEAGVQGIIVGHGTDTLAVTAAVLAFMLEDLPIPVLLVGAQRSSDRGSTDAALNLLSAVEFILKTDFAGVALCMHASSHDDCCWILPATNSRKMHTTRRDAFQAINDTPLARVDYAQKNISFFHQKYSRKVPGKKNVVLKEHLEEKVAIIRTHVQMSSLFIEALIREKYKGMVLEATGLGQAPANLPENLPVYEALKKFIAQGGIVVLTSQCLWGRVYSEVYTNCRRLQEIGVIFGGDMLTDTAFVKLAWLLGNYSAEETRKLLLHNLRGELHDRTPYVENFLTSPSLPSPS